MVASKWADAKVVMMNTKVVMNIAYFPSRFNEYQGCDDVVVVGEALLFLDDGQSLTCLTLVFRGLGSNKFQRTEEISTVALSCIKRPMVYRVNEDETLTVVP